MNQHNDARLLAAWRAGDRSAGNVLLLRHFAPLRKFLRHRAGADADEVLQRTMLACVASHQRIRGESTFRTYLFTIARHELYRWSRQRAALRRFVAFDESAVSGLSGRDAAAELVRAESLATLRSALNGLRESERVLLGLFYVDELDSPTLAETFGIKPSSVRARIKRARGDLERAIRAPPSSRP